MTSDDSQVFLSNFEKKNFFFPIKNFLDLENFQFSPSLNKRVVGSGHRRLPACLYVCLFGPVLREDNGDFDETLLVGSYHDLVVCK